MFSFSNLDTSEFQSRGSNTLATIRASVISAIDTKAAHRSKKMTKIKVIAMHKMVASIEKKIMHRRMDFWLPFRVQMAKKSISRYEEVKTTEVEAPKSPFNRND